MFATPWVLRRQSCGCPDPNSFFCLEHLYPPTDILHMSEAVSDKRIPVGSPQCCDVMDAGRGETVNKSLILVLAGFVAAYGDGGLAYGATRRAAREVEKLRSQFDQMPSGTGIVVKLKDHRTLSGDFVASAGDGIEMETPEPLEVKLGDIKTVAADAAGQSAPGGSQPAPQNHHRVRTVLIVLGIGLVLYVALAVAAK